MYESEAVCTLMSRKGRAILAREGGGSRGVGGSRGRDGGGSGGCREVPTREQIAGLDGSIASQAVPVDAQQVKQQGCAVSFAQSVLRLQRMGVPRWSSPSPATVRYRNVGPKLTDWPTNMQRATWDCVLPDRASLQPSLGVALDVRRCRLARTLTAQAAAAITWGGGERTDQLGWRRYRPSLAGAWQA